MAIKVNESYSGEGFSNKLYTGVSILKIIGVNPTQEELKALGYRAEKEPVYFQNKEGVNNLRIVFMLETKVGDEKITFPAPAIFLRDKKAEYFADRFGKMNRDATKLEGDIRNPYEGEMDLLRLIRIIASVRTNRGEELILDTIDRMVSTGDISELRAIVSAVKAKNNTFKGYLTVRNNKYQSVYLRKLEFASNTNYEWIHKDMSEQRNYIKDDLGGVNLDLYNPQDFVLKEWNPSTATAQSSASSNPVLSAAAAAANTSVRPNTVSQSSLGSESADVAVAEDEEEDSPF